MKTKKHKRRNPMIPGVSYSDAPRCADCHGRALLTEDAAAALAQESGGRLKSFECTAGDGWHVWCPLIEHRNSEHR